MEWVVVPFMILNESHDFWIFIASMSALTFLVTLIVARSIKIALTTMILTALCLIMVNYVVVAAGLLFLAGLQY